MQEIRTDILIVGAGPGGAMAALTLARAGISCVLADKSAFPRDKICGDALSGKVVELLTSAHPELLAKIAGHPHTLGSWGVTFVAPNRKPLRVPFKSEIDKRLPAPGFIMRRMDFDNLLVEECRSHDLIDLREGCNLTQFEKTGSGWRASDAAADISISCKLLIAADGAHSRFAKQHGGMKVEPPHYCAGIRAYYKGVTGMDEDNFIELHFIREFLPGYFWIFPLADGYANVGAGMRSDKISAKKVNLRKLMLDFISKDPEMQQRFAQAEMEGEVEGFGLPLGSVKRKISGGHFMLTGDAASLIDPFTGEGIGNAMYSGYFAAMQAVESLKTGDFSAEALSAYDQQVYARLWEELKLSRKMQELVKYPWLFNLVVNKARRSRLLRETISGMFEDMEKRERLKNPLFYLRLILPNGH